SLWGSRPNPPQGWGLVPRTAERVGQPTCVRDVSMQLRALGCYDVSNARRRVWIDHALARKVTNPCVLGRFDMRDGQLTYSGAFETFVDEAPLAESRHDDLRNFGDRDPVVEGLRQHAGDLGKERLSRFGLFDLGHVDGDPVDLSAAFAGSRH